MEAATVRDTLCRVFSGEHERNSGCKSSPDVTDSAESRRSLMLSACNYCRSAHRRCSGGTPCSRCMKLDKTDCSYVPQGKRGRKSAPLNAALSAALSPQSTDAPSSVVSANDGDSQESTVNADGYPLRRRRRAHSERSSSAHSGRHVSRQSRWASHEATGAAVNGRSDHVTRDQGSLDSVPQVRPRGKQTAFGSHETPDVAAAHMIADMSRRYQSSDHSHADKYGDRNGDQGPLPPPPPLSSGGGVCGSSFHARHHQQLKHHAHAGHGSAMRAATGQGVAMHHVPSLPASPYASAPGPFGGFGGAPSFPVYAYPQYTPALMMHAPMGVVTPATHQQLSPSAHPQHSQHSQQQHHHQQEQQQPTQWKHKTAYAQNPSTGGDDLHPLGHPPELLHYGYPPYANQPPWLPGYIAIPVGQYYGQPHPAHHLPAPVGLYYYGSSSANVAAKPLSLEQHTLSAAHAASAEKQESEAPPETPDNAASVVAVEVLRSSLLSSANSAGGVGKDTSTRETAVLLQQGLPVAQILPVVQATQSGELSVSSASGDRDVATGNAQAELAGTTALESDGRSTPLS
eukprot:Opistho-2@17940